MKKIGNLLLWFLSGFMAIAALVYMPSLTSGILLLCAVIAAPVKPLQELLASQKIRGAAKGGLLAVLFLVSCVIAPTDRVNDRSAAAEPSLRIHEVDTPSPAVRSTPTQLETTQVLSPAPQAPETEAPASPPQTPAPEVPASPSQTPVPEAPASPSQPPAPEAPASPSQAPAPEVPASPSQPPAPEVPASPSQTPVPEVLASPSQTPSASGTVQGGGGNGDASRFDTWNDPAQQQTTATWVLNTSTKKIHYPGCKSVKKIAPKNYSTSNLSEEELIAQGYSVCKQCH